MRPSTIRIGTSGWIYRHWRGRFYPADLPVQAWFDHYAKYFDTVEINNTFYRLPAPSVFSAWKQQAPPGFVYALKASRYLTHLKKLKDPEGPLELFLGRARRLEGHLGPILYQLPPHWHCDVNRLAHFLAALPADLLHIMEFRDPSWFNNRVRKLLETHRVGFCMHDLRGLDCPIWVTGPAAYVRFHGPTKLSYAGAYSTQQLRLWADRVRSFQALGRAVYVYFNNDDQAFAVQNAQELRRLLDLEPEPAVPSLPGTRVAHQSLRP